MVEQQRLFRRRPSHLTRATSTCCAAAINCKRFRYSRLWEASGATAVTNATAASPFRPPYRPASVVLKRETAH